MDFKIPQPVVFCNRIFTQVIYIAAVVSDHFAEGNSAFVSLVQQAFFECAGNDLTSQVSSMKAAAFLVAKTNQLNMEWQFNFRSDYLFKYIQSHQYTQRSIELTGIDYCVDMGSDNKFFRFGFPGTQ